MRPTLTWLFLGTVALAQPFVVAQEKAPATIAAVHHWNPEDLWRGIDVEELPLQVKILRSWEENGCTFAKLTYVSEVTDGTEVRIFGIQGAPKAAKHLPGILHIHGGGQTASLAWVQYWAKRDYACFTYDFCGPWENRAEYTDWGPLAKYCNMASNGVYEVHPSPRMSGWFHWALAGRRALTLMTHNPAVDPDRLGIFGISMGGTLCWLVAGSDARVKAAIPIYGCGYNVDRRKAVHDLIPSEDQLIYQDALTPEAHAPYIKCPIFFLSASNDHHGWMDDAFDSLRAVRAATRQAFTPRYIHHVDPGQGADMQPWMDWHLKGGRPFPRTPGLEVGLDASGVLRAIVRPEHPSDVSKVIVYHSLGMKIPPSRFWRRAGLVNRNSRNWTASLPVVSIWDRVSVFANVFYASGVCLSTELSRVVPGQLGKARPTLVPSLNIDDGSGGHENWFFGPAYTDPNNDQTLLSAGEDEGRHYVTVNDAILGDSIKFVIASHIFGDPQFQGPPGASLAFDCKGGFDTNGITITFAEGEWLPRGVNYKAKVAQQDVTGGWKTVIVPLSKFVSDAGAKPANWSKVDRLLLSGATTKVGPPLFSRFRWVLPTAQLK